LEPVRKDEIDSAGAHLLGLLPYRWISDFDAAPTIGFNVDARLVRELQSIGIARQDAFTLVHGIIKELIENALDHGMPDKNAEQSFLFGGALMGQAHRALLETGYEQQLRTYISEAKHIVSPTLHLLVGDVGKGLLTVDGGVVTSARDENASRKIVERAFDKWGAGHLYRPRARGLWKVQQIVLGYRGAILVRTGDITFARTFGESTPLQSFEAARGWMPGTSVECHVSTHEDADLDNTPEIFQRADLDQGSSIRSRLTSLTISLRQQGGLTINDRKRISTALEAAQWKERAGLAISVETSRVSDRELSDAIHALLVELIHGILRSFPSSPVAVVFPGMNPRILRVTLDSFDEEGAADLNAGDGEALLVLGADGQHEWVGGSKYVRSILAELSSNGGVGGMHELRTFKPPDLSDGSWQTVLQSSPFIDVDGETLRLRTMPSTTIADLRHDIGRLLQSALNDGSAGDAVKFGRFLTPSLRSTSHWIQTGSLLTKLRASGLAGFLLADRMIGVGITSQHPGPPKIVWVGPDMPDLVNAFSTRLGARGEYFSSSTAHDLQGRDIGLRQPGSNQVVIFTDIVSTGNSVVSIINRLRDQGMDVIAVATVIDARARKTADEPSPSLHFNSYKVSVISLAVQDIDWRGDPLTPIQYIDPVLGRPREEPTRPKAMIAPSAYIKAIKSTSAARLGHIRGRANRHYSAYVDSTLLFEDRDWLKLAVRRISTLISEHVEAHVKPDSRRPASKRYVCILVPEGGGDNLPMVAQRVAAYLPEVNLHAPKIVRVPRAVLGSKWVYPFALEEAPICQHIVVLDSGVGSGHSIRHMIRLAAEPNIESISAILLTNGLSDHDSLAFTSLVGVESRDSSAREEETRSIPVKVSFLARSAVGSVPANECGICSTRRRCLSLTDSAPTRMAEHLDWLAYCLEPRSKEEIYSKPARDILGDEVSQEECVNYLIWRGRFREAQLDTERREELLAKLKSATPDEDAALIRLMAVEPSWFNMYPLILPDARAALVAVVREILNGSQSARYSMIQVHAVMVLAKADPRALVNLIPNLGSLMPEAQMQLLTELALLVRSSGGMDQLGDVATASLERAEEHFRLTRKVESQAVEMPLEEIHYLRGLIRDVSVFRPSEPQHARTLLKHYRLDVADHRLDGQLWRILVALQLYADGETAEEPGDVIDDWDQAVEYLRDNVFPNLPALRPILVSSWWMNRLGPDDRERWNRVVRGGGVEELLGISRQLTSLLEEPASESKRDLAVQILESIEWWNRFFFTTSRIKLGAVRMALFPELIDRCPVELQSVASSSMQKALVEWNLDSGDRDYHVFCTSDLLKAILSQVRFNAEQRRSAADVIRFRIRIFRDEQQVVMEIWNTATRASTAFSTRTGGLSVLADDVKRFGGELVIEPLPPGEWTFGVSLRLQSWGWPK
jgi:orotate phosphoribosyltransferase